MRALLDEACSPCESPLTVACIAQRFVSQGRLINGSIPSPADATQRSVQAMRRHRHDWTRSPSEPPSLERATSVGIALPRFNFIEPKKPKRPPPCAAPSSSLLPVLSSPRTACNDGREPSTPKLDGDAIVYATLLKWAQTMEDPVLSDESKMTRLWQSLLRHSESGRFSTVTTHCPNAICSLVVMDILQRILRAAPGVSYALANLLIRAIGNSIFAEYEPEKPHHELKQYADIALELKQQLVKTTSELESWRQQAVSQQNQLASLNLDSSSDEDKIKVLAAVYRSVEAPNSVISDSITPFLNEDLLLDIWNKTAKATVTKSSQEMVSEKSHVSVGDSRKRATTLAPQLLHERVRLLLTQWQSLSPEERDVLATTMPTASSEGGAPLKSVLHSLEELYVSEQMRETNSSRRSMFLSPMARHASIAFRQPVVTPPTGRRDGVSPTTFTQPRAIQQRTRSVYFSPVASRSESPVPAAVPTETIASNVSVPDALMGALSAGQHVAATDESQLLIEQISLEQEEILHTCENIFDLLCHDPMDSPASRRPPTTPSDAVHAAHERPSTPAAIIEAAKQQLCELLCKFVDAPSYVMEKYERSESLRAIRESTNRELDDGTGTNSIVQTIIQHQKQNPMVLVNAINQSPEILLTAIVQNNGILTFAMAKFPSLVKRFLRLDLKSCEHLNMLAHKNKGVQLLWGTSSSLSPSRGAPTSSPVATVHEDAFGELESVSSRLGTLSSSEVHLLGWFSAHTPELAQLALKHPDVLKPLFVEMHTRGETGAFYKVMVQLGSTKAVQSYFQRTYVSTLEKIAQEDPGEVTKLLWEIFHDPPNRDLLHELQSSPYLATCLGELHPTVIQDVIASDMDTWKQHFVDTVSANDMMLRECLAARAEQLAGGEHLLQLFSAVVSGTTTGLNLEALDFGASASDLALAKEREGVTQRKMAQCVYLRGGSSVFKAVIAQLVATVGYNPHEADRGGQGRSDPRDALNSASNSSAVSNPSRGRSTKKGTGGAASTKKRNAAKKDEATTELAAIDTENHGAASGRVSGLVDAMPSMWQAFVHAFQRQQACSSSDNSPARITLTRAHAKTLILDIWIEFLKVDAVQHDNASLWTMAPFVCDFFVTRYESLPAVGAWLSALTEAMAGMQDDARVAFFSVVCGLRFSSYEPMDGYDTFLYYAHALGHLLYGEMKVFLPERRLAETSDGRCPIERRYALSTAARLFDHRLLTGVEVNQLMSRLEKLACVTQDDTVELDDVMSMFLDQWRLAVEHVDERYKQAFLLCDSSGSGHIGLEQFTKIVLSVTHQRVTPRECLLVFCDVGQELLDLDTLLRVTRAYHLRLFNTYLPEISLQESDLHELRQSIGRSNIFSIAHEVQDLQRFWKGLRGDVQSQVEASHQTKSTKMRLRKQAALIDKLLSDIQAQLSGGDAPPSTPQTPQTPRSRLRLQAAAPALVLGPRALEKAWQELRACAKMIHSAKLTQHHLSGLYLQASLVRWVRQARRRAGAMGMPLGGQPPPA